MFIKRWQNLVNKKRGEREREREREQIQRKQNGTWQRWRWIYFRCFHNDTDSKHALYLLAIMMSNTGPVITFLHIAAAHKTNHVTYDSKSFFDVYQHVSLYISSSIDNSIVDLLIWFVIPKTSRKVWMFIYIVLIYYIVRISNFMSHFDTSIQSWYVVIKMILAYWQRSMKLYSRHLSH